MSLQMHNVTVKAYGDKLLSDVNLACESGKLLGIVGENGAGKSTLLNTLAGLSKPTIGKVFINGNDIENESCEQLASLRAVLPQNSDLSFPLSAIEVVRLGMSLGSIATNDQEHLLYQCLMEFDAGHLSNRNYLTLSGGEKQRVQLARVIAQLRCHKNESPQFLLLDEPISALDLYQQYQTLRNVKRLTSSGIGVIAILHDLNMASLYCDQIAVLKKGELIALGVPQMVITEEIVSQAFNIQATIQSHPDKNTPFITPRINPNHQSTNFATDTHKSI